MDIHITCKDDYIGIASYMTFRNCLVVAYMDFEIQYWNFEVDLENCSFVRDTRS